MSSKSRRPSSPKSGAEHSAGAVRRKQSGTPDQSGEVRQGVQWVTVDEDNEGQRLDNFLLAQLRGVPKSIIYRVVRKGEVRVNKGRVRPDTRLRREIRSGFRPLPESRSRRPWRLGPGFRG